MTDLLMFVEDVGQEKFLSALIRRMAQEASVGLGLRVRSARGGVGRVLDELEGFVRSAERGHVELPDALVVAIDANCHGYLARRQVVQKRARRYSDKVIHAIPDPHIERWLLLDGAAFRAVLGKGCAAPDLKCEKARYKRLLVDAVRQSGVQPLLGGLEYAEDIVAQLDIQRIADLDASFGQFVAEFRGWLNSRRSTG